MAKRYMFILLTGMFLLSGCSFLAGMVPDISDESAQKIAAVVSDKVETIVSATPQGQANPYLPTTAQKTAGALAIGILGLLAALKSKYEIKKIVKKEI